MPAIREDDGHAWVWTAPTQGEGCDPQPRGPIGRAGVAGARVAVIEREPPHPNGAYRWAGSRRRNEVGPSRSTPSRRLPPSSRVRAWNRLVMVIPQVPTRADPRPSLVPNTAGSSTPGPIPASLLPCVVPGHCRGLRSVCQSVLLPGSVNIRGNFPTAARVVQCACADAHCTTPSQCTDPHRHREFDAHRDSHTPQKQGACAPWLIVQPMVVSANRGTKMLTQIGVLFTRIR